MRHYYPLQIFYEDTDAAGVVYHANYVKFMERARTVFLQQKGLTLPVIIDSFDIFFVVRALEIQYQCPARLQQMLEVETELTKIGGASLTFTQRIYDLNDSQIVICSGKVVIVCTNKQFKPCAIPAALVRELKSEH